MGNNYWIKVYHEMLQDPKVGRLNDRQYRTMMECFLLAGRENAEGRLPSVADMAWQLRKDEGVLLEDLQALAAVGILTEDDGWVVTKFVSRQAAVSDADRQKAYRDRVRHTFIEGYEGDEDDNGGEKDGVTEGEGESYEGVTNRYAESDTDTDTEADEDKDGDAEISAAAAILAKKLFVLTGMEGQPPRKLVRVFESLAAEGVIADDIQRAWDWYKGKNGFNPRNFEVLQNPIMKERQERMKFETVANMPVKVSAYDEFIQR